MKRFIPVLVIFLSLISLFFFAYRNNLFNKKPAGLQINSIPTSKVYINGVESGTTPFNNANMKVGSYTIKLIPEDGFASSAYETKVNLLSSTSTIVYRNFAATDSDSSGYVLEFAEEPGGKSFLSVVSDPDTANLFIDGQPLGYTPASKLDLSPGEHEVSLSSPGYKPQTISVSILSGHNLIAKFKLASDTIVLTPPSPSPSVSPGPTSSPSLSPSPSSSSTLAKPYLIVKETGTGWLRVRKQPLSTADELGKVNVGTMLKYLGETTDDGWHKVEFEEGLGWVSGKYTTLVK